MTLVHIDQGATEAVHIDQAAILRHLGLDPRDPASQAVILVCERYGLDPVLKHMILIKGRPYVTRDGYLEIAHRSGVFDGMEVVETGADQTHLWAKVSVFRKDMSRPFTFVGRYPKTGDNKAYQPEMAIKTAEVAALRRAFNVTGAGAADEMWDQGGGYIVTPVLATAEQVTRIDELMPLVPEQAFPELRSWKAEQGISMKGGEFTEDMADKVIAKLESLTEGGGSDVPPEGSPTAPPPPAPSSGGGGAAVPAPSAAATPGLPDEPEFDVDGDGQGSPQDVTGGGVAPVPDAREHAVPAASGGHTLTQLETALHQATGRPTLPASKTAILRAAATYGHTGTYDELLTDEALVLAVLAELGGALPTGAEPPAPVDLTPWKQRDEEAWDKWRRAANAKAGPGTKAKPHPRLLDEKPDYDAQRHALAFQASRRVRGEGNEVTSWSELTEAECMRIWKPAAGTGALADIEGGRAVWGFTDEVVPEATGGWWLSQKAKEVAA